MSEFSRRTFLSGASGALGTGWMASNWPVLLAAGVAGCERRASGAGYAHLEVNLGNLLEAVVEQIVPSDDTPGARDAGVVWFIDALVGGPWGGMKPMLEAGGKSLDQRSGGEGAFSELSFDAQTEVLKDIENGSFFQTMRLLTIAGMFAMPARGGNREKAGWAMIGFEDRHAWQPPFGHYDSSALEAKTEGDDNA